VPHTRKQCHPSEHAARRVPSDVPHTPRRLQCAQRIDQGRRGKLRAHPRATAGRRSSCRPRRRRLQAALAVRCRPPPPPLPPSGSPAAPTLTPFATARVGAARPPGPRPHLRRAHAASFAAQRRAGLGAAAAGRAGGVEEGRLALLALLALALRWSGDAGRPRCAAAARRTARSSRRATPACTRATRRNGRRGPRRPILPPPRSMRCVARMTQPRARGRTHSRGRKWQPATHSVRHPTLTARRRQHAACEMRTMFQSLAAARSASNRRGCRRSEASLGSPRCRCGRGWAQSRCRCARG
jgi:hypothetical protein